MLLMKNKCVCVPNKQTKIYICFPLQEMNTTTSVEQDLSSIVFTKWIVEGLALPTVGIVGIFGK